MKERMAATGSTGWITAAQTPPQQPKRQMRGGRKLATPRPRAVMPEPEQIDSSDDDLDLVSPGLRPSRAAASPVVRPRRRLVSVAELS